MSAETSHSQTGVQTRELLIWVGFAVVLAIGVVTVLLPATEDQKEAAVSGDGAQPPAAAVTTTPAAKPTK